MARKKDERDIPKTNLMAFDFSSGVEISTFIANNRLEESYRKFYYQDGLTLIIWADSVNELLDMYHQLKDYIMFDGKVEKKRYDTICVRDHYKLMPIPAFAA